MILNEVCREVLAHERIPGTGGIEQENSNQARLQKKTYYVNCFRCHVYCWSHEIGKN